jgi:hypothetical protein
MRWLIRNVVEPWLPTILAIPTVAAILYFGLPAKRPGPSAPVAPPPVTLSDCSRFQVGMSKEEVLGILQGLGAEIPVRDKQPDRMFLVVWYLDYYTVYVSFDAKHRVTKIDVWPGGKKGC